MNVNYENIKQVCYYYNEEEFETLCLHILNGKQNISMWDFLKIPVDVFKLPIETLMIASQILDENRLNDIGIWSASTVLHIFETLYSLDMRPRDAIEAKKKWVIEDIAYEDLEKARHTARYAIGESKVSASGEAGRCAAKAAWHTAWHTAGATVDVVKQSALAVKWSGGDVCNFYKQLHDYIRTLIRP